MTNQTSHQRAKDLEILIVLAIAIAVFGRISAVKAADSAAFLLLAVALLLPKTAARIAGIWLKSGAFLGSVSSRILLTIVFYLVLTPVAFLYRLFSGRDNLGLRKDPAAGSFWHKRIRAYGREDFEKGW